ncbi:hypothetical protein [Enhygromyxa salina]|uniref:Lipoprotein n=1 Tax=Enhygromyxa salina TaxID=215803 RepID=A0A2S9YSJ5_9BACT|nr:hypothetical protein [Enhygromyxa salina]PRQ08022.1 hypothetical protein ENSA7_23060 [Enhygromyxa salina]
MPRPRRVFLCSALLGASVLLTACAKKPSEAQCDEFADHFVKLLEESRDKPDSRIKKLANDQRDKVVEACVSEGSVAEVECVLAQTSIAAVESNCK